jgi:hypothetical protein
MKPLSSWPLVSAFCTLAAAVVTAVVAEPDDDDQGTPLPPLTAKLIEQSACYGCTDEEIADLFVITESYLRERYGANLVFIRAKRTYELRKAQFELATKKGNCQMLTWLGRNELQQSLYPGTLDEPLPILPPKVG